jgi:hypothetical protein
MRNLTLSIDDDILLEARKFALENRTTVNQLVRDYLSRIAAQRDRRRAARERLKRSMRTKRVEVGERRWAREDIYER